MISLESLSQELLPNLYVKNVTLDTNYVTSTSNKLTPNDTGNSRVMLSAKFVKNDSLMSDLALLLDSELNQDFKIYVHQITSKSFFDQFLTVGGGINSIYDSSGKLTEEGKVILTRDNSNVDFISTKIKTFSEAILNNNAVTQDSDTGAIVLPEEVLDNGTILNEIVFDLNFDIPKDVEFLAYVLVVGVNTPESLGNPDSAILHISNPKKEIVILDGTLQSRGLVFTIAPFAAGQQNVQDLLKFGNPGDVWAGPVHEHQGVFMAGAVHSNEPHPRLEYSIVPITKFIDNRIKDKIQKTILNTTKAFESLNSLTSRYLGEPNFLNFKEYMSKSYISDIYLAQDQDKNISGMFFVDKLKILKYNSAFSAMFDIAEKTLSTEEYEDFLQNVLDRSDMLSLRVFEGNNLLGFLTQGETSAIQPPDDKGNSFSMVDQSNVYIPDTVASLGLSSIIQIFSFKHVIASSSESHYDYHVEVEYKDPTIEVIKEFFQSISQSTEKLAEIINYINGQNGFDPVTQRIKYSTLQEIKEKFSGQISEVVPIFNGPVYLRFNGVIPSSELFSVLFYVPDINAVDFLSYLLNLTNLSTVTQDGLLVLQDFMLNTANKLSNSLNAVGSKQPKDNSSVYGDYGIAQNPDPGASEVPISIPIKGKKNRIRTYDYGYDFTGLMDSQDPALKNFFIGRQTNDFLKIFNSDFKNTCKYLFSRIALNYNLNPAAGGGFEEIDKSFRPGPFPIQTPGQTLYSYLNIPTTALAESVLLPSVVSSLSLNVTNANTPKLATTSIVKLKNLIIENNSRPLGNFGVSKTAPHILKEDLISILAQGGTSLPGVGQTQIERVEVDDLSFATQMENNLIQKDFSQSTPTNDISSIQNDPGFSLDNTKTKINPNLGAEGNKFKTNPTVKQLTVKSNFDTTKNKLMNSLLTRKLLTNAGKNNSFDLKRSNALAYGFAAGPQTPLPLNNLNSLPNQVACLSANVLPALSQNLDNPFLDFGVDQGYIKDYVVNPDLLSEYWFKHQNIVKVEYLSGFESYTEVDYLKNQENPYAQGQAISTTENNINKPEWKLLTADILDENRKLFCRVTRYSGFGEYINSYLVRELDMPLINSYFIIN